MDSKDDIFTPALHLKQPWSHLAAVPWQLLVFPDEKLQPFCFHLQQTSTNFWDNKSTDRSASIRRPPRSSNPPQPLLLLLSHDESLRNKNASCFLLAPSKRFSHREPPTLRLRVTPGVVKRNLSGGEHPSLAVVIPDRNSILHQNQIKYKLK